MKTPKITKLLPLAMALMMMSPAVFAAAADSNSSTMTLTVDEFINITKEATTVETAGATFDDGYTEITIEEMTADFKVINNKPGQVIQLYGSTNASGSVTKAICGASASSFNLVFTNQTGVKATVDDVTNITNGSPQPASNKNAIAFAVSPNITPDAASGATAPETLFDNTAGTIKYTISNGIFDMKYPIATTAVANTFSTHDTYGEYSATLLLSKVTP